jgi:hypothetical protein
MFSYIRTTATVVNVLPNNVTILLALATTVNRKTKQKPSDLLKKKFLLNNSPSR